jgi:hypothetical protein
MTMTIFGHVPGFARVNRIAVMRGVANASGAASAAVTTPISFSADVLPNGAVYSVFVDTGGQAVMANVTNQTNSGFNVT